MSHFSICFAVYQNEGSLNKLYTEVVNELIYHFPNDTYELIFINDGSKDNSLKVLKKIKESDSNVKVINFSRNFGQMASILAGWEYSSGDVSINMSSDLQDPPSQIVEMIREWKQGNEIVVSYRKSHKTSFSKKITSKLFYKLMFPKIPPGGFDVALIDKKPLKIINSLKEKNRFFQFDILDIGFKIKFIPYDKLEREHGKSQYNFFKRFKNFYSGFLNVSYLPIRVLTLLGFSVFLMGIFYSLSIIYSYFYLELPFQGWAPIMIAILLIGGMLMLMIGILGEYIWRILDEIKSRPKYIIDEIL